MGSWGAFNTVVVGLLAVILLASCIILGSHRGDQAEGGILRLLSAAGLTATFLFGIGLVYHLVVELWYALHLFG